jgi:hypothetical protein
MQSAPANSVIILGILQDDGIVRLDHLPEMRPGRVQITMSAIAAPRDRIPDPPLEDSSGPPAFDLPRIGITRIVQPFRVGERLPDSLEGGEVA